ncbi:MAG TPA: LysE family transporter, partial [Nevskiaceae bacterium]|nr:LysE family transporter [Nevskiaceae bacterium]
MSPLSLFLFVASAHALGVASPGPDFAMVVRQTLAYGRRIGVITACGIGSGILFHVAWGLFGLGWVLDRFPSFLEVLRYAGAAFLLWIGWNAIRAQPIRTSSGEDGPLEPSAGRAFGIGLLTNILNAKAMLFFVALFSVVLAQEIAVPFRLFLGAWIALSTAAWFSFVA